MLSCIYIIFNSITVSGDVLFGKKKKIFLTK
jgi:hypothetical protein